MKRDRAELENYDFNREDIPLEKKRKIQKNKDYAVELHVGENELVKSLAQAFQSMGKFEYFGRDVSWKIIMHDNNNVISEDFLLDNVHSVTVLGAPGLQSMPKVSFVSNFVIKNSSIKFENIDFHINKTFCISDTPYCEFVRCQIHGGLIIRKLSKVDFKIVEIAESKSSGLVIQDQSQVKLHTCSIHDCTLSNIIQMDQTQLQISNSRVFRSQKTGIWVRGSALAKIVHCDIYENKCSNICLSHDSSNVTVQKCKINDSAQNGIVIRGTGCGNIRIERNVIKNNKYPNVYLKIEDDEERRGNNMNKGGYQNNMNFNNNGNEGGDMFFFGNNNQQMRQDNEQKSKKEIIVTDNEISFGNSGGILVKGSSKSDSSVVIVANKIFSNKYHPVVVSGSIQPMINSNDIRNNQKSDNVKYRD